MEYLLDNASNQNINAKHKFKPSMLRFSLCDYNDAYTLVIWNISVNNTAGANADAKNY